MNERKWSFLMKERKYIKNASGEFNLHTELWLCVWNPVDFTIGGFEILLLQTL